MTTKIMTVSGAALPKSNGGVSELIPLGAVDNVYYRMAWDSNTERRWFAEAKLKVRSEPRLLRTVIVKPEPILLGETKKAPKYYPDFLVQTMAGAWWLVEVKGAVVTPTWKKVRRIIEDRIESRSLLVAIDGAAVPAGLMIAYWVKKQWQYDYVQVPR